MSEAKIIYKTVKKAVAHCSECDTEMLGNGSEVMPYICLCGEWEFNKEESEYKVISSTR